MPYLATVSIVLSRTDEAPGAPKSYAYAALRWHLHIQLEGEVCDTRRVVGHAVCACPFALLLEATKVYSLDLASEMVVLSVWMRCWEQAYATTSPS